MGERIDPRHLPEAVGEDVWIDVIRKMDEVYNDLLQYEVTLEEKNAALEESQVFIESVLGSMSDILIVCGRKGTIEDVNPSLLQLTGLKEDDLRGQSVAELFAAPTSREEAARVFASGRSEAVHDLVLELRGADGSALAVSLNGTPRVRSGKLLGTVITGRPVGELRRAYQALRQAHEDLKRTQQQLLHSEKMASLGRLVAGVAHELNNPISFVLGNVHAMHRYTQRLSQYLEAVHRRAPPEDLAEMRAKLRIDRIIGDLEPLIAGTIEGAERTHDIVDALKRFSAVDREQQQHFAIRAVLDRSLHWVAKAAPGRVQVAVSVPEDWRMLGSPGQIQQVLMNLVQNAYDATAGEVSPRLEVNAREEGGEAVLEFRDNGPGIASEDLPRIFDPFFTTKPVGKGTGLGLTISYGIVERHGGRLAASNHPDGGALFTLRLPLSKSGEAPARDPGAS
ncbi:MAG TPA: ATP-binding protein [Anaeromyxobacteraceae bacterium]|nr:ATP-binding protein [Anaeromyxobacteraceae bacterium]